jgi:RND superfamily putative drug exporter
MHRHRAAVLCAWGVVVLLSGVAALRLDGLLSNRFNIPGTDSERVRLLLQDRFGQRNDATALLVVRRVDGGRADDPAFLGRVDAAARQAASALPRSSLSARATPAGGDLATAGITTPTPPAGTCPPCGARSAASPEAGSTSRGRSRSTTTSSRCSTRTCIEAS